MALLRKIILKILSSVNYFYRTVSVFHNPSKQVVLPGFEVDFNPCEKKFLFRCAQTFNFEIDYSGGYRQKEISVNRLKDTMILGNSGALVWQGKVITESAFDMRRLALSPAWRWPALMLPEKKSGLFTAIFHLPWAAASNYHWFFDCLPRVYALIKGVQEPITLIMPAEAPAFQVESLTFILNDFPEISVAVIGKHEKWICEEFILPSFIAGHVSGYLPAPVSDFLLPKLLKGYNVVPKLPERKIYISRSKSSKRRIFNEAELIPVLQKNGIEVIFPEKLSYREQVQLFYESRLIIGAHGAGFTNTFFAQKATVLELHPANAIKPHYFLLCKGLGFDYHYLIGSNADEKLDFTVPVEVFERKLSEILLTSE